MKNKKLRTIPLVALMSLALVVLLFSCTKDKNYNEPASNDKTKPGVVTNIRVENFNGGAHIIYTLPNSPNLLYVMADYEIRKGVKRETKASYYTDTITVQGFATAGEYQVTLEAVSRANVKSDPVQVTVHPQDPYYKLSAATIQLSADFGGVNVRAQNPNKRSFGYILLELDPIVNEYGIVEQHYDAAENVNFSVRGYNTQARRFGAYIRDEWGNTSDTVFAEISPLFETQLNKSLFFKYALPSDTEIGYGWDLPYLWDGKTDGYSNGWHTNPGGSYPMICTFGLGVYAKLSRFVLYNRPLQFAYSHGNPRKFSLWGTDKVSPQNAVLPAYADEGTVIGDWVNLGNFNFPDPPSGLMPGATNASDEAFVAAGVNFNIPLVSPKTRYIRLNVAETWSGGDFAHAMEITFFGDPD